MILISRRTLLQTTPFLITAPLFLEGCAGTAQGLVSTVLDNPYKDLNPTQVFIVTAKTVMQASDSLLKGLGFVGEALGRKKQDSSNKLDSLLASKKKNIGEGLAVSSEASSYCTEQAEKIKQDIDGLDLTKLTPAAEKKLISGLEQFGVGNFLQAKAGVGGFEFAKRLKSVNVATEFQALINGRNGVTMTVLQDFPSTISGFTSNIQKSYDLIAASEKVKDFSDERKAMKDVEAIGKGKFTESLSNPSSPQLGKG